MLGMLSTLAAAQVKDAFLDTSGEFMKSEFCKIYKCELSGTIKLGSNMIEQYYRVSGFKNPGYGISNYLVFITQGVNDKGRSNWKRAGVRYPPAQDKIEDGAFAVEFLSFISGVPLQAYPSEKLLNGCTNAIKGKSQYFFVKSGITIGYENSAEEFITISLAHQFGKSWFDDLPPTARVSTSEMCMN